MSEKTNNKDKMNSSDKLNSLFSSILSNLPFPAFISDSNNKIIIYNDIFRNLSKENPHIETAADNSDIYFEGKKTFKLKFKGKQKYFSLITKSIEGHTDYLLSILQDITKQHEYYSEYEDLHRQHEILMKVAPSGIFYVDANRKITFWNKRAEEITGFKAGEVVGRECFLFSGYPCDNNCRLFDKSDSPLEFYTTETVIKTKKGSSKIVSKNAMILRDNNGKTVGAVESIYDLTDLIRANTQAHESELKFRSMSASAQDGIIMMNDEGAITFWNRAAERIFGYKKEDVLNTKLHDFLAPERYRDKYRAGIHTFRSTGSGPAVGKTLELMAVGSDGLEFPVELSLSSVRINKRWHAIGIIRDITFKKIREKDMNRLIEELSYSQQAVEEHSYKLNELTLKMIESERELIKSNDTKDKFFSILAHDLKNPLASFRGVLNMLISDIDDMPIENIKEILLDINSSSENLQELLENILQWSRSQRNMIDNNPETVNLYSLVNLNSDLLSQNLKEKNIQFINSISKEAIAYVDMNMLNTVVRNIISNAIKFTNIGGRIQSSTIIEENNIKLIISDNGLGMDSKTMDCLFMAGKTKSTTGTKNEKGTGLGLLLCNEFVNKMDGKIDVRSELGEGTDIILTLPLSLIND